MPTKPQVFATYYTAGEEIVNSISHGIGALLSIAGMVAMIVFAVGNGTAWHIVSFSIFGSSLVILYLTSTLYHSLTMPEVKKIFQRLDHIAIFLLIAGTYTPFTLVSLRGAWGWSLFGVVWGLAVLGIILKICCLSQSEGVCVALYLIMGWLCLIAIKQLLLHTSLPCLILLVCGGVSYTVGVIFYVWERLPYNHAIWHLFVLAGSILHYFSVLYTL